MKNKIERRARVCDFTGNAEIIWRSPTWSGFSVPGHRVSAVSRLMNHVIKMDKQSLRRGHLPTGGAAIPMVCLTNGKVFVQATCKAKTVPDMDKFRNFLVKRGAVVDNALF